MGAFYFPGLVLFKPEFGWFSWFSGPFCPCLLALPGPRPAQHPKQRLRAPELGHACTSASFGSSLSSASVLEVEHAPGAIPLKMAAMATASPSRSLKERGRAAHRLLLDLPQRRCRCRGHLVQRRVVYVPTAPPARALLPLPRLAPTTPRQAVDCTPAFRVAMPPRRPSALSKTASLIVSTSVCSVHWAASACASTSTPFDA